MVVSKWEGSQEEAGGAKVVSGVQGDGGWGGEVRVAGCSSVSVPLSFCLFPGEGKSTLCGNPHTFLPSFTPEGMGGLERPLDPMAGLLLPLS